MSNTTRWIFKNDLQSLSLANLSKRINKINKRTLSKIRNLNVKMTNSNKNRRPLTISFNKNTKIYFYVYRINYTKILPHKQTDYTKTLILYTSSSSNNIYALINKNYGAKTLLRYIFNISKNKELTEVNNDINSNVIMWLIKSTYYKKPIYKNAKKLQIELISGFSGDTPDSDNTININGNNTMNLLSTLSFLLESDHMKRIILWVTYKKHKHIEISFNINNTISIQEYLGPFNNQKFEIKYGINYNNFLPYLMVYCDLLPKIISLFDSHKDKINIKKSQIKFIKNLANKIRIRVKEKLKDTKTKATN